MKRFARCLAALCALSSAGSALANTVTLEVSALIDGRDQLIIQADTLQWHHLDWAAVGRFNGGNEPTVISTTLDGVSVIDHEAWIPDWPAPPPDEIRFPSFSSVFTGLTPTISSGYTFVTLTAISARSSVQLVQLPSASNGFTTILDFNDDPFGGPAQYDARLTFQAAPVPEPNTAILLAAGGAVFLGHAWRRRRRGSDAPEISGGTFRVSSSN